MIHVGEILPTMPQTFENDVQKAAYTQLERLNIPFKRVQTDEVITMEDCAAVDEKLDMKMVKTLFLCNRQRTEFYLFITCGDKPFKSKDLSAALGVARLSFAPTEMMQSMLGTKIGAATVFSVPLPSAADVQTVVDADVLKEEFYGCSDGTTTCYMKIRTRDIFDVLLPENGIKAQIAEV